MKLSEFNVGDKVMACGSYSGEFEAENSANHVTPLLQLIKSNPKKTMNYKEKFILLAKKKPEKSFRKAGILDGNDIITQEGLEMFCTWLLQTKGEEFKKEVVDKLLADKKKKK